MKLPKWLIVESSHKTPKHIQEQYIQAAKEKRGRRAKKWAKIAGKP